METRHYLAQSDERSDLDITIAKSERSVRKGLHFIFAIFRLILTILIAMLTETLRLFLFLIKKLVIDVASIISDLTIKPLFTTLHNSFLQPLFVFLVNVLQGGQVRSLSPMEQMGRPTFFSCIVDSGSPSPPSRFWIRPCSNWH
eukprot:m.234223 g.234223  ORF g.234223 m.234223 type:complete len:144 (-) comp54301_c0_seq19:8-439(-)